MNISGAIEVLQSTLDEYGDLEIIGGCLHDDTPLSGIFVVDRNGVSLENGGDATDIEGVFLE